MSVHSNTLQAPYHMIRSVLGLDGDDCRIIVDNARTHKSTYNSPSESSRRHRRVRRCLNKPQWSKSPPCRWEAVKEFAPSMPHPRSPTESRSQPACMPLRKPIRVNSFNLSGDIAATMSCAKTEQLHTSNPKTKKDGPPTQPRRLMLESRLLCPDEFSFSSTASSLEEIWQLLDGLTDISTDSSSDHDSVEASPGSLVQVV